MTRSQIFFWLLVAFIAGVAAASFLPLSLPALWAFFVLGGVVAAFAGLNIQKRRAVAVAGYALVVFALGLLWFLRSGHRPPSPLEAGVGQAAVLNGLVDDEPRISSITQRLVVRVENSEDKILVITRRHPEYRYGDEIKLSGRLERPENFSPDFDYTAYLAKDDIFYSMAFPEIEILARGRGNHVYQSLFNLKSSFADNVGRYLPEPQGALALGLTLGEREGFPEELSADLRTTGTSHIAALSGYNITIVAEAMLWALAFLFIPLGLSFWLAASGIIAFTMLTGAAASVVRAAVMGLLVLIARRAGRLYRMRNALTLAAAVMLFHNPKILRFDAGFQLSFLATLGLLYLAPLVERAYEKAKLRLIPPAREAGLIRDRRDVPRRRRASFLRNVFISTLAAQIAVLPLLVYQFGALSLVSPLANLAVIPFIPATMFFVFLTGSLAFLWEDLAWLATAPAWTLLTYELSAIRALANLPGAAVEIRGLGLYTLIGGYTLIGYWLWHSHRSNNKRKSITQ